MTIDMWEVLVRTPRGNHRPRNISLLLATLLMACFSYLLVTTPSVHAAAPARWNEDNTSLLYQGNTYTPVSDTSNFPEEVTKSGGSVFQFEDTSVNPHLVHVIFFPHDNPQSEKEATYIRYTLNPPNRLINPTDKTTITIQATSDDGDGISSSCTIDGIGWMVCPIMNGIAEGMDFIFERIRGFLVVQPMTTSVNNPVYRIWQVSRDLANITFVIGFLVIIYSYIVGGGFSGYQIRKIIPRLVIAAVLINISYVICAAAVDASNIAGYGINQLFEHVRDTVLSGSSAEGDVNWTSVTTWVLAGGGGAIAGTSILVTSIAGSAAGLWFLLAPFLLGAALLVMVTFLILAARQAIIVLAIAIAPLAFAAYILPNTEKWFERWRSLLFTMLVMFPAFAAVFGGAQLAGEVIIRMAAANGSIEQIILGLGVMVAPLAITPLLLRLGGGILNRIGGMVNNQQKGLYDRYKGYNKERLADHVARNNARNAEMRANNSFRRGVFGQHARRYAARNYAKNNYRSTQRKLNEEAAENAWHSQGGRWGYDSHGGEGVYDSHLSRRNQGGRGSLDTYKRDNQLRHDLTNAHHDEHWQNTLNADATRRAMLTDTRLSEGRAKVISGAHEAQDERALRTAITGGAGQYAALRDMQVQATVDSSYADAMKGRLETEGKLQFKQEFSGSSDAAKALRRAFYESKSMEKEMATIDTIMEKRADERWEKVSTQDDRLRNLRLQAVEATDSATKYEEQWNKLIANIRAQGAQAPGITLNADKTAAGRIQQLGQDIEVEKWAQESAKRVEQANMSGELKANAALRTYAGGIGGDAAANRIYAKAKSDIVHSYLEDVKSSRSVLSEYSLNELINLHQGHVTRGGEPATDAMVDAAMQEIMLSKGNNWAFQKTKDYIASRGMHYDEMTNKYYEDAAKTIEITDQNEIDRRRDEQQMFVDAVKNSKLTIKSLSGTDRGDLETGTFTLASEDAIIRDLRDQKINANRMADTDIDELMRMVQVLRDDRRRGSLSENSRNAFIKNLEAIEQDPLTRSKIAEREWKMMNVVAEYLRHPETLSTDQKVQIESLTETPVPTNYAPGRPYGPSAKFTPEDRANREPYGPDGNMTYQRRQQPAATNATDSDSSDTGI